MHQGEHLCLAEPSVASVVTPSFHPQFQCYEQPGSRWLSEGGSSPPAPEAEVWSWEAHVLIGGETRAGPGSLSLWEPNHNFPVLKTREFKQRGWSDKLNSLAMPHVVLSTMVKTGSVMTRTDKVFCSTEGFWDLTH